MFQISTNKLLKKLDKFLYQNQDYFTVDYELQLAEFANVLSKFIFPIRWKLLKNKYNRTYKNKPLNEILYKLKQLSNLEYIEETKRKNDSKVTHAINITKKGYERIQEIEDLRFKNFVGQL